MCARFEFKGRLRMPGKKVLAADETGPVAHPWAGFARNEILDWWEKKGCRRVDLPATRFAERSERTGRLVWGVVPQGSVIRGLLDLSGPALVRVVTRPSTDREKLEFEHPRMPVIEPPLHPSAVQAILDGPEEIEEAGAQLDLF